MCHDKRYATFRKYHWPFHVVVSCIKEKKTQSVCVLYLAKNVPTPYYWPNFLYRSKFTWMSAHLWESFAWSLTSTTLSIMWHIWGKKLCVVLHQRLLRGIFAQTDELMQCTLRTAPHLWWHSVVQSVVCCQDSTSKLLVILLHFI